MARRLRMGLVYLAITMAGMALAVPASAAPGPATELVPANAILVVEIRQPETVVDLITGKGWNTASRHLPQLREMVEGESFRNGMQIVRYLETRLGTDWKPGVKQLTGAGVTLASLPGGGTLLILDGKDAALLRTLHEVVQEGVLDKATKAGRPELARPRPVHGVDVWALDETSSYAVIGTRLVMSDRVEVLSQALELAATQGKSLLGNPAYQAAAKAADDGAAVWAYTDWKTLMQVPTIRQQLEPSTNPMMALLTAGVLDAVRSSSWAALSLGIEGDRFDLRLACDGKAGPDSRSYMVPPAGSGAAPVLEVTDQVASLSLYRDLRDFYGKKDALFPERTSGIIFFENMMGIFFTGRDLTGEVFASTEPQTRLVVAEPRFEPGQGVPQVQLPAFAAVFTVSDPERFKWVIEEAWQKSVGLVAITSGQRAEPGMIIDRVVHNDVKYSVAGFAPTEEGTRTDLPMRYNFRPTLACVGPYVVMGSAEPITRDLIDALKREQNEEPAALAGVHTVLDVDADKLAALLRANRATLVTQNMVEKGHTQAEAEQEIDILFTLMKLVRHAALTGRLDEGPGQLELSVELNFD